MDRDLKKLKLNEALSLAKQTSEPSVIIELSRHPNATMRKRCLVEMCPCRVECDIEAFWSRIFEMVEDTDALVRAQVLHTLCDGNLKHSCNFNVFVCSYKLVTQNYGFRFAKAFGEFGNRGT